MYRYLAFDFLTGEALGELLPTTSSYSHISNAPGAVSLTMPLHPARPGGVDVITPEVLQPGRTKLYVERDGEIMWGGMLWGLSLDSDTAQLSGQGFGSYFRRRLLRTTKTYVQADQALIVKDLIDWAQAEPGGGCGVDTSALLPTGVLRDRTYLGYERKTIDGLITDLAAVNGGFDFSFDHDWAGEHTITTRLLVQSAMGRPTDTVFEMGSNCSLPSVTVDGLTVVNRADATGSGQADQMLIATANFDNGFPLLEDVESFSDISEQATLNDKAERMRRRGWAPTVIPSVEVFQGAEPSLGSYAVNDVVRVIGHYGLLQIDGSYKITGLTVDIDERGAETPKLTLANVEVFA